MDMRGIALLVSLGALASCTTAPDPVTRSPDRQMEYERLIAGKVAGPPVKCLRSPDTNDMVTIDENTVAYRLGRNRVYINHMQGTCGGLGRGSIMVTRSFGNAELCQGDIAQMVDQISHMTTGSCVFGDFIPYARPR
jgi:hypothetical protein